MPDQPVSREREITLGRVKTYENTAAPDDNHWFERFVAFYTLVEVYIPQMDGHIPEPPVATNLTRIPPILVEDTITKPQNFGPQI